MKGDAKISQDQKHRYTLWRSWDDDKPKILFIGLNPSRADATFNDPTITRCIGFAKSWGYGGLHFGNLYSFRTPDPKMLIQNITQAADQLTDTYLQAMINNSEKVICCWGSWKFIKDRAMYVLDNLIPQSYCFGYNKDGQPKHPLYLRFDSKLILFSRSKAY